MNRYWRLYNWRNKNHLGSGKTSCSKMVSLFQIALEIRFKKTREPKSD